MFVKRFLQDGLGLQVATSWCELSFSIVWGSERQQVRGNSRGDDADGVSTLSPGAEPDGWIGRAAEQNRSDDRFARNTAGDRITDTVLALLQPMTERKICGGLSEARGHGELALFFGVVLPPGGRRG